MPVSDHHPQAAFAATVDAAEHLLRYAAEAGIALPDDTIAAIVHAKACAAAGAVPEDASVAFYAAFTALSAKVAPVTVDTLRVPAEKTSRSLRCNGVLSFVVALLVVALSGVTFATGLMSKDIADGLKHANELAVKLRTAVGPPGIDEPGDCTPALHEPNPKIPAADTATVITDLQDFSATIRTMLRTATKLNVFVLKTEISPSESSGGTLNWSGNRKHILELEPGLLNMRQATFCKIATYQDVRDFAQNVNADTLAVYGALSAYLLPVLYALLGACAFNLRDFSERVKQRTYHALSYANTARTIAAMTVGAIISLFNIFNRDATLQPLAVAFLAGYGVEAFFAFLDTLLAAFRAKASVPSAK